MSVSEREGFEVVDPAAVKLACAAHWDAMFGVCYRILGDVDEAREATQHASAVAIAHPPKRIEKNWRPWLCGVARNVANDLLAKKISDRDHSVPLDSSSDRALPDQVCASDVRMDTERLVDRIRKLLGEDEKAGFDLYAKVAMGERTEKELAGEEAMSEEQLRRLRDRMRAKARQAAIAACLEGCADLAKTVDGQSDSPALLKVITAHAKDCAVCRPKRDKPLRLLRKIMTVLGVGLMTGLLRRLGGGKRILAATAVVTTVAVTAGVIMEWPDVPPFKQDQVTPIPILPAPQPTGSVVPAPPAQPPPAVEPPPAPPATEPPPVQEPPPPLSPPTATGVVGRASGTCDDEPHHVSRKDHRRAVRLPLLTGESRCIPRYS